MSINKSKYFHTFMFLVFLLPQSSSAYSSTVICSPAAPDLVAAASASTLEAHEPDTTRLDGDWDGAFMIGKQAFWEEFSVQGAKVSVHTHFGVLTNGGVAALKGRSVHFSLGEHGRVDGQIDLQGLRLTGVWTRTDAPPEALNLIRRPQTPVAPLPYTTTDVSYTSGDGVKIAGTITAPRDARPKAAVVLIAGSKPSDRNYVALGASPAHKPFAVLADNLTRHGLVVLRYDARGVGLSGGSAFDATEAQKEDDVLTGVRLLASRPDVDPKEIGVIGHSAGGVTAGRLAATTPSVAFAILLSSPALPLMNFVANQARSNALAEGLTGADLERRIQLSLRLNEAVASADSVSTATSNAMTVLQASPDMNNPLRRLNYLAEIAEMSSDYYRFLLKHDPRDDLKMLKKPVLFLQGDRDQNVSSTRNLPAIEGGLADDKMSEVCLFSSLNHQLRYASGDANETPEDSVETIDVGVLQLIDRWLISNAHRPN